MQYLRDLSHRAEFAVVITFAFGYFILGSTLMVLTPPAETAVWEDGLWSMLVYELSIMVVLSAFLAVRGWSPKQLGLLPNKTDPGVALALGGVAYTGFFLLWLTLGNSIPGADRIPDGTIDNDLRLGTVLMFSLVNGIFEEIFVCGYVISALRKTRSLAFAINVSIAIRLSYHLYQGPAGVVGIIPVGLVFAHWYARTGRLWPIAIAHCLFDIWGLWPYLAAEG